MNREKLEKIKTEMDNFIKNFPNSDATGIATTISRILEALLDQ